MEENRVTDLVEDLKELKSDFLKLDMDISMSDEVNLIFEAMAKAQLEMETATTDSANPFFKSKYADLKSVINASRPYLAKNGICVLQPTWVDKGNNYLITLLGHSSGQWIKGKIKIEPVDNKIQTFGSYLTYLRRYCYASQVGVATGGDDDGEAFTPRKEPTISQAHASQLINILNLLPVGTEQSILDGYKISNLMELKASVFTAVYKKLKSMLEVRNENN